MAHWPKSGEHVVLLDGGIMQCLHCRATHDPFGASLQPIGAIAALAKWFTDEHADCPPPSQPECTFCGARDHDWLGHVNATCRTPLDWLTCGDTGVSSRTLWSHMVGRAIDGQQGHPLDPDDLGRCIRLLDAPWAKGWRNWLHQLARRPGWDKLVPHWAELEALYREEVGTGSAPKCYARMRELLGAR